MTTVSVIGSGYVGTTVAACLADAGHYVINIDIDEETVDSINAGAAPIHEPGLSDIISAHAGPLGTGRLRASTSYDVILETEVSLICLPTPSREDGSIDRSIIEAGTESLAKALESKEAWHTVAVKSTIIPTTCEDVLIPLIERHANKSVGEDVGVATNPEFLREGSAVNDFRSPHKVVVGTHSNRAAEDLRSMYGPILEDSGASFVRTGPREAEMIKYANNAFLASKISLINDIGNICKEFGVDAYEVADAIGLDDRIGARFLRSGLGWGGDCFPKDMSALIAAGRAREYDASMLAAAVEVNDLQPERFLGLLDNHRSVAGERVAVLGLSFKPGTDDVRNSRAIPVIEGLLDRDAEVAAYDPIAQTRMREVFPEIQYHDSPDAALQEAVAALVVTGWPDIAELDEEFDVMQDPIVIDGRHVIDRRDGIVYEGLTW